MRRLLENSRATLRGIGIEAVAVLGTAVLAVILAALALAVT